MAYALEVYIIDGGDHTIKVQHTFYGVSEEECKTYMREHLANCEYFRSAQRDGRLIEELEEIEDEDLPDPADFDEDFEEEES